MALAALRPSLVFVPGVPRRIAADSCNNLRAQLCTVATALQLLRN
jgi:hypothetical protein